MHLSKSLRPSSLVHPRLDFFAFKDRNIMKLQKKFKSYYHNANYPRFLRFFYLNNIQHCIKTIDHIIKEERDRGSGCGVSLSNKFNNTKFTKPNPFEQAFAQRNKHDEEHSITLVDDSATVHSPQLDLKTATCHLKILVLVLVYTFSLGIHSDGHVGIEFSDKVRIVIVRNANEGNLTQPSKKIVKIKMSNDRLIE
ncbi:hypothetical protein M9H77_11797 [Catharanthus roseus]|uniref:Uncharacterized protein n=1 Tax=Catharanthus roseus TaxID=4058 RepID=A0ACC0BFN8_CATRO|nr:hypothetical protein M9H77_11797 [Catharanthus roseus]